MRLAVLADIHGNLPAFDAVMQDMAQFDIDHVIVAGDSINMGPFSSEVIERIANERWAVIRGNHEIYMLERGRPDVPDYRRDWTLPQWLNDSMPDDLRNYVATLPDTLEPYYPGQPPIRVIHASPGDHFRGIYQQTSVDEVGEVLETVGPQTVITGHTHLPLDRWVGRWRILNPGSVGLPLDGRHGAHYMLLEGYGDGWRPVFRQVQYNPAPVFERFAQLDFVDRHGGIGLLVIEELKTARTIIWGYVNWKAEHYPDEPDTVDLAQTYLNDPVARWHYLHPMYRHNLPDGVPERVQD